MITQLLLIKAAVLDAVYSFDSDLFADLILEKH